MINDIYNVKKSACNVSKNLELIKIIKSNSLNDLNNFRDENDQLLFDINNKSLNKKSSVIKKITDNINYESILNDFNNVFKYIIESILILNENNLNFYDYEIKSLLYDLLEIHNTNNLLNCNFCELKFNNYFNKDVILLKDGLTNFENEIISYKLKNEIRNTITNNNVFENVKNLKLSDDDSKKLLNSILNDDTNGIKSFLSKTNNENNYFEFLNKIIENSNNSKSALNTLLYNVDLSLNKNSILNYNNSIKNNNNVIENENKYLYVNDILIKSINGSKSDEIKNQSSSQVNNMLLDEENSKVNISNDIIISMYQFIDESCDDYEKLTNEHISLD